MGIKRFEYLNSNIPFLKKDVGCRLLFTFVFFGVFVWQFVSLLFNLKAGLNIGMTVSTVFVLLIALLFAGISIMYALKSMKILSIVKKKGRCTSSVQILFNTSKKGFMKLYSIVTEILSIVCAVVLICTVVYSFLEMAYFSTISYFMPVLAIICFCGFNSVYHINAEIATVKNVQEYHSMF